MLSGVLGRKITHRKITGPELVEIWKGNGVPDDVANVLGTLDVAVANGVEEKVANAENRYVGKQRLADWIEQKKAIWNKA